MKRKIIMSIEQLKGLTIQSISGAEVGSERIFFETNGGSFRMYHVQDCCESVRLNDITGDVDWLIGNPVLNAEESSNHDTLGGESDDSHTWTFYRISTIKGTVTLRWLGESNGYYGESVEFEKV